MYHSLKGVEELQELLCYSYPSAMIQCGLCYCLMNKVRHLCCDLMIQSDIHLSYDQELKEQLVAIQWIPLQRSVTV